MPFFFRCLFSSQWYSLLLKWRAARDHCYFEQWCKFQRFLVPYFIGGIFYRSCSGQVINMLFPMPTAKKWGRFWKEVLMARHNREQPPVFTNRTCISGLIQIPMLPLKVMIPYPGGQQFSVARFSNNQMQYNLRAMNFNWDTAGKNGCWTTW